MGPGQGLRGRQGTEGTGWPEGDVVASNPSLDLTIRYSRRRPMCLCALLARRAPGPVSAGAGRPIGQRPTQGKEPRRAMGLTHPDFHLPTPDRPADGRPDPQGPRWSCSRVVTPTGRGVPEVGGPASQNLGKIRQYKVSLPSDRSAAGVVEAIRCRQLRVAVFGGAGEGRNRAQNRVRWVSEDNLGPK